MCVLLQPLPRYGDNLLCGILALRDNIVTASIVMLLIEVFTLL
jgi:hypothetical protein